MKQAPRCKEDGCRAAGVYNWGYCRTCYEKLVNKEVREQLFPGLALKTTDIRACRKRRKKQPADL